jgi:phosphoadenosine phosphosulfate reductase
MALSQLNLEGRDPAEEAIEVLRAWEPPEGYYLSFSGGKDSIVLFDLAERSGVKFDAHYNVTGIDPPELVYFIREHYGSRLINEKAKEGIWHLVERKGLPMRNARFCCEYLKEHTGIGRTVLTGIRGKESPRRSHRCLVENSTHADKLFLHPIINWSTPDVWEYIRTRELPYCSLYDELVWDAKKGKMVKAFSRLGCVLCPMTTAKQAARDIARWPKLAAAWESAAGRFYDRGTERTKRWPTKAAMFTWWLSRKAEKKKGQVSQPALFV